MTKKEWENEWIDKAEDIVCQVYVSQYEGREEMIGAHLDMPAAAEAVSQPFHLFNVLTHWFLRWKATMTWPHL